jgi:hypothetical protein
MSRSHHLHPLYSLFPIQIRAVAKSMKLDEAAEKSNAQAIIAAFTPFKDSKVMVPAHAASTQSR